MKVLRQPYILMLVVCLWASVNSTIPCPAATLLLNGNWNYATSDGAESGAFRQDYSASLSGRTELTDLAVLSSGLRYTRNMAEDSTVDRLTPYLSLDNTNDLYRLGLTGSYSITMDQESRRQESWSWNGGLASTWEDSMFRPQYDFYVGQSGSSQNGRAGPISTSAGARINYDYFEWLSLGYDVGWSMSETRDGGRQDQTLTQTGRLKASKGFFDSRLRLNFSQVYQERTGETSGTVGASGFFLEELNDGFTQVLYEETDDHSNNGLDNDASFLLSDTGPGEPPADTLVIDPANPPMNIGLQAGFIRIDEIHLVTTVDISAYACDITWDLYSSSDGLEWTLVQPLACVYNPDEQRYEFDLDNQTHEYLKLVGDAGAVLATTEIRGMELYQRISGTPGQTVTVDTRPRNTNMSAGLAYRVSENITFSYHFNLDRNWGGHRDSLDTGHHGSLGWTINRWLSARFNSNWSRDQREGQPDSQNRTYSASLSSQPLPTLSVAAGFSRSERYPGDREDSVSNSYALNATARLYQDLHGALNCSYSAVEKGSGTDSVSTGLQLTARLRPTLTASLDNTYGLDIGNSTYSNNTSMGVNWRVSSILSLNNSLAVGLQSSEAASYRYGLSGSISPNERHRLGFAYGFTHSTDQDSHRFGSNWQYIINPVFNFHANGSYLINEAGSSWSVSARLTAQYRNL